MYKLSWQLYLFPSVCILWNLRRYINSKYCVRLWTIFCLEDSSLYMTAPLIHTLVGWLRLSWHIQPTSQCGGTAEGWITQNLSPPSESISSKPLPQKMFPSELSYSFQTFAVLSCNWCGQTSFEVCCDIELEIASSESSILCCGGSVPFYAKHLKGLLHQLSKFVII